MRRVRWLASPGARIARVRVRVACHHAGEVSVGYTLGMKTAISIPDDIFAQADALARVLKTSRSDLYTRAVREYVARHGEDEVTAA